MAAAKVCLGLPVPRRVGDGITDLEAVQISRGADIFVGFGGVVQRARVMQVRRAGSPAVLWAGGGALGLFLCV